MEEEEEEVVVVVVVALGLMSLAIRTGRCVHSCGSSSNGLRYPVLASTQVADALGIFGAGYRKTELEGVGAQPVLLSQRGVSRGPLLPPWPQLPLPPPWP